MPLIMLLMMRAMRLFNQVLAYYFPFLLMMLFIIKIMWCYDVDAWCIFFCDKFQNLWYIDNFFSKCGQRMADSDAGEGNKNLEYSSKFIRQILLQETPCAKPPPFLHWINIPQNWSTGTFGNVLFLSLSTPGREVLRETTSEGFYGRWAISGTVNWRRWPGTTINGPLLISGVGGRPFSDVKPLSTKMCTVDSFCGQEAPKWQP